MQLPRALRPFAYLLFLVSSVTLTASRAASPIQCEGCVAELAPSTGFHINTCPGAEYYVQVEVEAENGMCVTKYPPQPTDPCLASGCDFSVSMAWKLPNDTNVELCNTYSGTSHCVQRAANGGNQNLQYPLDQNCNDIVHNLTNTGTTPCGTIQAQVFTRCTVCDN